MAKVYGFNEDGYKRVVAAVRSLRSTPRTGARRRRQSPVLSGSAPVLWGKMDANSTEWTSAAVNVWTGLPGVTTGDDQETATELSVQGQMPGISLSAGARVLLIPTDGFPGTTPYQIQPLECPTEEEEEP
jgi:hypothetical protein